MAQLKEPPDVRIIVGKGQVMAVAISKLARENRVTTFEIARSLVELGYKVLGWDEYHRLLDEIGNLIPGDEQQGKPTEPSGHTVRVTIGIPVTATNSTPAR